jgi:choline dehydrogenase-like flavoprotein
MWDFVVVGATSAGVALAQELSGGGERSVLLMTFDGGLPDFPANGRMPGVVAPAVRPHVLEFDGWAAAGASEWAPESVLPHFKQCETDREFGSLRYHGSNGPLSLWRTPEERLTALDRGFRVAAVEKGHPWAPDHNAPGVLGVSPMAWGRWEAASGIKTLSVDAVDRVLLDGDHAAGMRVLIEGAWQNVEAKEVILCAGGVATPGILQRSGIGPAGYLDSVGIKPVLDLPVGQGVQVHPQLRLLAEAAPGMADASGSSGASVPPGDSGPLEEIPGGMLARWNTGLEGTASGDLMAWTVNGAGDGRCGLTGALAQVFSRGAVRVAGPDPATAPLVEARMLSDSLDGYRFRLLYRHLSDLAARPSLAGCLLEPKDAGGQPWEMNRPSEDLDHWLRSVVEPMGDYAGGCRMGSDGDPAAVVDGSGRVRGMRGLRVADSSVSPTLVRAAPLLTDVVIARKVARMITEGISLQGVGKRP